MQSTGARIALAIGAVAVVVVLFVVLQGGDDSDDTAATTAATTTTTNTTSDEPDRPAKPKTPTISINSNGDPVGGVKRLSFDKGDRVRFDVKSKIDDSVHVHVYDIEKNVAAGKTIKLNFPATIEGVFEVESHTTGTELGELRVNP